MLKRMLSVILCGALTVPMLVSCGKDVSLTVGDKGADSNNGGSESSGSEKPGSLSDGIANFTAPKDGEQVIIMKVKDYGEIKIKLFPEYAEKGVENFVGLAQKGYYDNLTYHRVIKDFMIQGGDPMGTGMGGESLWGGKFDGGTDAHLIHAAGAVAYANSGNTSTNGSQFYIVTGQVYSDSDFADLAQRGYTFSDQAKEIYSTAGGTPWLDGGYTVFGQVYDGLDVVYKISEVETYSIPEQGRSDIPSTDVVIESVKVGTYDGGEIRWKISDYK